MIMDYFALEPEVAGGFGKRTILDATVHPPVVEHLNYEFGWGYLGDELLENFPCFIVTQRLADILVRSGLGSFYLDEVEVTFTPDAQEEHAGKPFPHFLWLRVTGTAGQDDLGVTGKAQLVVSERALQVLRRGVIDNCGIEPYLPEIHV